MKHLYILSLALALLAPGGPAVAADEPVTLERIMADPDWLGTPPKDAFWAADGDGVYFMKKRIGEEHDDLWYAPLDGEPRAIDTAERDRHGVAGGDHDRAHATKAFTRHGELYLQDLATGDISQLTRSGLDLHSPVFLTDGRIAVRGGNRFYAWDPAAARLDLIAELRVEDDPVADDDDDDNHLAGHQRRLFEVLRERAGRREAARERERADIDTDPGRPPRPWYLGDGVELDHAALSPNGRWLLVATSDASRDRGRTVNVPSFVTDDGYLETLDTRPKVGTPDPVDHALAVLDLGSGVRMDIDTSVLPGIGDEPRPVVLMDSEWNGDGTRVALMFRAWDNKDRWIASVQPAAGFALTPRHRLSDEAWINWYTSRDFTWFNDFGWMPDDVTLWYLSEESGYSHLYLHREGRRRARALTRGDWEVSRPVRTRDGAYFYFNANREHPGIHEVYRVGVEDGDVERLTHLEGATQYALSPGENRLSLTSSNALRHDELFVQDATPGAQPVRVTRTMSDDYLAYPWIAPEVVAIPSSNARGRVIHTRVYVPRDFDPARAEPYPAVMFAHGAGYLQNAHYGWSGYFREFMFHTYLAERGFVVFDMDYRASAGYGRDWRTAIYRRMGTPEVEDFVDGVAWMAEHYNVDPSHVGIYGGSYGGFVTFMSLFREPGLFAAGAALRPVADWMYYAHSYTANILNTPQDDPEAYLASSPIEYAAGLDAPLLILAPMVDTNVLFQDSVRLVQRLIELGKTEHFETAIYPVEDHGFREPSSWLDEYRRIYRHFDRHLR